MQAGDVNGSRHAPPEVTVGFRFDDPSSSSDHALEARILDLFARHQAPLTIAVIPARESEGQVSQLSSRQVPHLRQAADAGFVEIAQHGYSHLSRAGAASDRKSEFRGLPPREQKQLMGAGREILTNVFSSDICGFVPPWNTYDAATAAVAADLGFQYLSAGWEAPEEPIASIPLIPRTTRLPTLTEAVEEADRYRTLRPAVVVVLHHYDFNTPESGGAPSALDALDAALGSLRQDPRIVFKPVREIADQVAGAPVGAFATTRKWRQRLPWRLQWLLPGLTLVPTSPTRAAMYSAIRRLSG